MPSPSQAAAVIVSCLAVVLVSCSSGVAESPERIFGSLCSDSANGAGGPQPVPDVGVQFHGTWLDYDDQTRGAVLDSLVAGGATAVRIDAGWRSLQPRDGSSWDAAYLARLDSSVHAASDRGLSVLVTLLDSPRWAGGGDDGRALPQDPADYARAVGLLAGRYAGVVRAWEVWNEPNSDAFARGASAADYAELLMAASPAIRTADSSALVVFGGVQYNDDAFVREVYDAGARGTFDVMATHPYEVPSDRAPSASDDGTIQALGHVVTVRDVMVMAGDAALPIWFTEFGWSSHGSDENAPGYARGVSRDEQATRLEQFLGVVQAEFPYVTQVFWYTDRDRAPQGSAAEDLQLANYGVLDTALEPKPVLVALACYMTGATESD